MSRILMTVVRTPDRETRALRAFPVPNVAWAERLERTKKMRRLTDEEVAELEAAKKQRDDEQSEAKPRGGRGGRRRTAAED